MNSFSDLSFREPTKAEQAILQKMLGVGFPGRDGLLRQTKGLMVRQIDVNGSLDLSPPTDAPTAVVNVRVPVEAELDDLDGTTVHLLLHIVKGLLNELEVYREDSAPVQRHLSPEELRVATAG